MACIVKKDQPTIRNRFPRKKSFVNRSLVQLLLLVVVCMVFTACKIATDDLPTNSDISNTDESIVETTLEYHWNDYGNCRVDVRIPNLNSNLPNAEQMNEMINSEFRYVIDKKDVNEWETAEGYDYTWYQYDYYVADFDGVYSIAIYSTISSAYGAYTPMQEVRSFYYDKRDGKILSDIEFLEKIGRSKDDMIRAYIDACCPAYTPEQIDFSQIPFYFNEHNELVFLFSSSSIFST